MPDKETTEGVLLRQGWLSYLPTHLQQKVLQRLVLKNFEAGQPIYHVGDPPGGIYGLVSGAAAVAASPGVSGPYLAHFALPGTWFGHAAAITMQPRRVGVAARRRTTAMYLPIAAMDEIAAADPSAWRYFALNVVLNLDLAIQAHNDLMIRDPQTRICAILLRLSGHDPEPGNGYGPANGDEPLRVEITQSEIAEISNLSRNGVGRIFQQLSEAGVISTGYRNLTILEPGTLIKQIADQ